MSYLTTYDRKKTPPTRWGLLNNFSIGNESNDLDWTTNCHGCVPTGPNISECNKKILVENIQPWMRLILEIGVCKDDYEQSSAKIFIENKDPECTYYGLDLVSRGEILPKEKNVNFLQGDSKHVESNISVILKNHDYIDLLFIDGFHSVNMVFNDWQYAKYLRPGKGVVIVHDTNFHSGPWCLMECVDPKLFDIQRHCVSVDDFGIGVLKRK